MFRRTRTNWLAPLALLALSLNPPGTAAAAAVATEEVGTKVPVGENGSKGATVCEHYNATCVEEARLGLPVDMASCAGTVTCPISNTRHHICYAVWVHNKTAGETGDPEDPAAFAPHPSGYRVKMMGCFVTTSGDQSCLNRTRCVWDRPEVGPGGSLFCCCQGNMCNSKFDWEPSEIGDDGLGHDGDDSRSNESALHDASGEGPAWQGSLMPLMYALVPVVLFIVVVVVVIFVYRQRRTAGRYGGGAAVAEVEMLDDAYNLNDPLNHQRPIIIGSSGDGGGYILGPVQNPGLKDIQLLEIKARGRFGAVWKGDMRGTAVAVKIFPLQDRSSWLAEQEIYNLPQMDHENILRFLGAERKGENLQMEFWLTTELHEKGSLCDFLKSNVVSWEDLCKIAHTMASGLTHLHEEIPKTSTKGMKPAIAHRDFKSKNVLIKADLTACVADFGLALVFEPGKSCGDTHGQVGTRRYMAPEVLEGAINFSRDAFLRIDMYACALVLWELVSRCTAANTANFASQNLGTQSTTNIVAGQAQPVQTAEAALPGQVTSVASGGSCGTMVTAEDYKLPFEAECSNPSLEQMQELVVNRKVRPKIKEAWRSHHPGLSALCETIEECWDQDAEARLSASCVMERIWGFRRLPVSPTTATRASSGPQVQVGGPATAANGVVATAREAAMNALNTRINNTGVVDVDSMMNLQTAGHRPRISEMTPLLLQRQLPSESAEEDPGGG